MTTLFYPIITKKKIISQHIEKFEFNLGIMVVSCWRVEQEGRYYLIDSGMGQMASYLLNNFMENQQLEAVFLTHGHSDHISGVATVKQNFPDAPVLISQLEFAYISGEKPYPKRKKTEKKVFPLSTFLSLESESGQQLQKDAGIEAVFTPGHSPGHHCFYHAEDDVLIAGDLFTTNRAGQLKPPMKKYTADLPLALKSGRTILENYPKSLLSICHGTEVENNFGESEQLSWLTNPTNKEQ
ncbi:MBL fold metallo-hydrolase [Enterococcus sp. LJL90]